MCTMNAVVWLCLLRCISFTSAIAQSSADFDDDLFDDERRYHINEDTVKPLMAKKAAGTAFKLRTPETYYPEAFFLILLIAYAINFWRGRRINDAIVLDWASQFCKTGTLLDRNFALVGPGYNDDGEELVMKNSHSEFQLWASGRRCAIHLQFDAEFPSMLLPAWPSVWLVN